MRETQRRVGLVSLAALTVGCLSLGAQQSQYRPPANSRMSGFYELESTRGDDPRRAADTATRSLPPGQRDRAYQSLLGRLDPPQTLSIDCNGYTVTIASSLGPRSAFDADGRSVKERGPDGRTVTTHAELNSNRLTVSTSGGSRGSDFSVTFESLNNGADLRVTRRLDDDDLRQPVTIQSYYRRIATEPRWDLYASGSGHDTRYDPRSGRGSAAMSMVPDGTRLVATLDTSLSMRTSRNGEPFTMTVRSPSEFQGARIDGVVSRVSANQQSGNGTDMRFDFQTIEVRGRVSEFDAYLNTVRLSDGTLLRVNGNGDVADVNHDNPTLRNGAIGVAVGAIIGAIAGGGKGAAIGAVVGGAGGVIVSQGHEQLNLSRGAEVTLTAVTLDRGRS